MRIFAIKDETLPEDRVLGYLIYYPNAKKFYIELPENADPWETPLLLSSFVNRGEYSVNSYWSRMWTEQRIIPPDRQNIGQILKENGLSEYDEFELLLLANGRCAQDSYYIEEISADELPSDIAERWQYKMEDVVPLSDQRLLTFFRNGEVKIADIKRLTAYSAVLSNYLNNPDRFNKAELQPDGYGVFWSDNIAISDRELYMNSDHVPISLEDFCNFIRLRIINSSEAANILGCSRQNIDDLTKRGKLHPVRTDSKNKLYLRNEVIQRQKK